MGLFGRIDEMGRET